MQTGRFLRLVLAVFILILSLGVVFASRGVETVTAANSKSAGAAHAPVSSLLYLPVMMSHSPLQTVFGIESHDITTSGGLDLMVQAKTTWVRRNGLLWSDIEPTEGVSDWSAAAGLEQEMINASQNGLNLILVVRSTPTWAQKVPGYFCGPVSPDKLQAFGDFMYEAVKRYSAPPYNVHYWQIWNEPDVDPSLLYDKGSAYGCWGDETDSYYGGTYYAEALKAIYPRIKQANPRAQVVIGGLLLGCHCIADKFLEGILRHQDSYGNFDGKNYFDGVAFHAYDDYGSTLGQYNNWAWQTFWNTTGPVLSAKAQFVKSVLSKYNASEKYIMNTEAALRVCGGSPNADFDTTKAYYIAQLYAISIVEEVTATIWYDLAGGWCNTNLLNPGLSLSPAYQAFATSRNALQDAKFIYEITAYSGVKGYEFNRGGHRVWILWSLDGSDHSITLPYIPLSAYDAVNNPVTINGTNLTITLTPIYLEWNP